jgi:hypothetical protein
MNYAKIEDFKNGFLTSTSVQQFFMIKELERRIDKVKPENMKHANLILNWAWRTYLNCQFIRQKQRT